MPPLFFQDVPILRSMQSLSPARRRISPYEGSSVRPSSGLVPCIMRSFCASDEAAEYPVSMMQQQPEPGVGLPDLGAAYELPIHAHPRLSNANTDHWLTSESPVARASAYRADDRLNNPYRLPSLSGPTRLPSPLECANEGPKDVQRMYSFSGHVPVLNTVEYAEDAKYDIQHISNFAHQDPPPSSLDCSEDIRNFNSADDAHMVFGQPARHLHMSEVDNATDHIATPALWNLPDSRFPTSSPDGSYHFGRDFLNARYFGPPGSPYTSPSLLSDSPMHSPCLSVPDMYSTASEYQMDALPLHIPRSTPNDNQDLDEGEEITSGKPYAQLIQECLLQAPGHRMMLRDIYDWFEMNTTKPRESGGNGWQNSIRHNLSMNKAFENDKTTVMNARGVTKKATSVWYLTEYALRNGVESTTRYRKQHSGRRSAYTRDLDWKRQNSGSRGGKAARKAAQMRRMGANANPWASRLTPGELEPFDHLVHAANVMSDHPETRGSSPMSPSEHYPCTPPSPISTHNYPLDRPGGLACHGTEMNYNDMQLQQALCQAGYGPNAENLW